MCTPPVDHATLPYRIAVLCYLYDDDGHVLLIHRRKQPNLGRYSPVGGKLEVGEGESPHDCAVREIREEVGIRLGRHAVHLTGIVSETAYEHETHWLMFLFEVTRTVAHDEIQNMIIDEGDLEWVPIDRVPSLAIPETDRLVMWPLVQTHRGGFFVAHIDCRSSPLQWSVRESMAGTGE